MSRHEVLVVDDSQEVREVVRVYLEAFLDVEVITAGNSIAAMEILDKESPDLCAAVVDVLMLGYGGVLVNYLKSDPRYSDIPMVFYTGIDERILDPRLTADTKVVRKGQDGLSQVVDAIRKALTGRRSVGPYAARAG